MSHLLEFVDMVMLVKQMTCASCAEIDMVQEGGRENLIFWRVRQLISESREPRRVCMKDLQAGQT